MIDWRPLKNELRLWRREGLDLPIWWRDDDAVAATDALDRLRRLAESLGLSVHVAVIPDLAEPSLARAVTASKALIPVVHGWRHRNHAPPGDKKAEFGHPRSAAAPEIHDGLNRLRGLFGGQLGPMFVPPWNRIAPGFLPSMTDAGYRALSAYRPRKDAFAAPGLLQVNTHLDPIDWRGTRGLVDPARLVHDLVADLQDRRMRRTDAAEPYGLLTHHLVHTDAIWHFTGGVLSALLEGGARPADPIALQEPPP